MACKCFSEANEALHKEGLKMPVSIGLQSITNDKGEKSYRLETVQRARILVQRSDDSRRRKPLPVFYAHHCPFCGTAY